MRNQARRRTESKSIDHHRQKGGPPASPEMTTCHPRHKGGKMETNPSLSPGDRLQIQRRIRHQAASGPLWSPSRFSERKDVWLGLPGLINLDMSDGVCCCTVQPVATVTVPFDSFPSDRYTVGLLCITRLNVPLTVKGNSSGVQHKLNFHSIYQSQKLQNT